MQDLLFLEQMEMSENDLQKFMHQGPLAIMNGSVYTIPVVFHVIHLGEPVGIGSNISSARMLQALSDLNDQFTNVGIDFCLAKRTPEGTATSGINRVNGSNVADYTSIGIVVKVA